MMKTTVTVASAAALLAGAEAGTYWVTSKTSQSAQTACPALKTQPNLFAATPYGNLIYLDTASCALTPEKGYNEVTGTDLDKIKACFSTTATATSFVAGADDKFCPQRWGSACDSASTAKFCQTGEHGVGAACDDKLKWCNYPMPVKALHSTATFASSSTAYTIPDSVAGALVQAINTDCSILNLSSPYSYAGDAKATVINQGWGILPGKEDSCDAKKISTAVRTAIDAWNEANPTSQYAVTEGDYEVVPLSTGSCFDTKTGKFSCKNVQGCTLPCAINASCTANNECGGGKCVKKSEESTDKVCYASAMGAFVAPVIAAAVAVAFF